MKQSNSPQPPRWPLKFFQWYCHPDYQEDIAGDLQERFERRLATGGVRKARWEYSKDVIRLFRPGLIRSFRPIQSLNNHGMFRNHFKLAWRNLIKQKLHASINIAGLAVGVASFVLITLYVYHELSYDRYHENADNIYRIVEDIGTESEMIFSAITSLPLGPTLAHEYSDVLDFVRLRQERKLVSNGDISAYEEDAYLADSSIFQIFSFPLLEGDAQSALTKPKSVVLTETTAQKYFGDKHAVGQTLSIEGEPYQVTGVVADVPTNSHFTFDMLISLITFTSQNRGLEEQGWFANGVHTYLLLSDENDKVDKLRAVMPDFIAKYTGTKESGQDMYFTDLPLQPLSSIYLEEPRHREYGERGSKSNLYVLSVIALFILLIACFNYVNLTIAQASRRTKEVGLRKVMGAERRILIQQFLGESIIVCFFSMLIGLLLAVVLLPSFNNLLDTSLQLVLINHWYVWPGLFILGILLGILAGAYPAFLVSGFHPLHVSRQSPRSLSGKVWLRNVLVGGQFVISITLIAGTLLVFDQLTLLSTQKLGFTKEQVLKINFNGDKGIKQRVESIEQTLTNVPGVAGVTASQSVPGISPPASISSIETEEHTMANTNISTYRVDHDFISNYGIQVVAGRTFSLDFPADDSTAFLINEAAVEQLGWTSPETALGSKVKQAEKEGRIVGVVQNFHYQSLHHTIEPLLIHINRDSFRFLSIKITSDNIPSVIANIETQWKILAPDLPFLYSFLDEDYDSLYRAEEKLSKIVSVFSGLAVFIACLGLLGLTTFSVERRLKEVGIRKVLGATARSIIVLFSAEFIRLIVIALLLAIPITYFIINIWLENFSSRIAISPLAFVIAGGVILLTALLVISCVSIRATQSNPIDALRNE